jgi:hypothetical protein
MRSFYCCRLLIATARARSHVEEHPAQAWPGRPARGGRARQLPKLAGVSAAPVLPARRPHVPRPGRCTGPGSARTSQPDPWQPTLQGGPAAAHGRNHRSTPSGGSGTAAPLVGRREDVALLDARRDGSTHGTGQLLVTDTQ